MDSRKMGKVLRILLSGKVIDWVGILILGIYAMQGYNKVINRHLIEFNMFDLSVILGCMVSLICGIVYIPFKYRDWSFISIKEKILFYGEKYLRIILLEIALLGYLLNYPYTNVDFYLYLIPFYVLTLWSLSRRICKWKFPVIL